MHYTVAQNTVVDKVLSILTLKKVFVKVKEYLKFRIFYPNGAITNDGKCKKCHFLKKRIFLPLYRSGGMILNAPINTRTSAWRRVFLHCKKNSWKLSVTNCCQWSFVRFSSVILLTNFFFLSNFCFSQSQTKLTVDLHFSLLFWRIASVNKAKRRKNHG